MTAMLKVRAAFDPLGLCNPGKIIPMLRGCGEGRAVSLAPDVTSETPPAVPPPITVRQNRPVRTTEFSSEKAAQQLTEIVGSDHVKLDSTSVTVAASFS